MSTEPRFYTAPTGRVYVDVGDVAKACGLAAMDLDLRFRPDGFAHPRDFLWAHGRMWFAVASLQQVVDALFEAGQGDAAILLRDCVTRWMPACAEAAKGEPIRRLPHNGLSTPGKLSFGAPVDVAPASESRLLRWEREQE